MRQSTRLGTSTHLLNSSTSKQKFSFSKSDRFSSPNKLLCNSFYEIPTTKARRSTSFGYGYKNLGIRYNREVAPVGTYELPSEFKPNPRRGFGFGKGREDMEITGPMRESMLKNYIPGPGNYPIKSALQLSNITLKSRLPDHSLDHLKKLPGPGTYQLQQLGSNRYYITSQHPNHTNRKFSTSRRSASFVNQSTELAPNAYDLSVTDINPSGRYVISKQESTRVRQFSKEPRKDLVFKHMLTTPGPGTQQFFLYCCSQPFSDFGPMV